MNVMRKTRTAQTYDRLKSRHRDRLLEGDIARAIFEDVVEQARGRQLLSAEHFTVDGTLLEAWAGSEEF